MLLLNKDSLLCWQQEAIKRYYAVSELHGQPSWMTGAVSQGSSGGDKVINFITHIVLSIHINLERNNGKNILPSKQPNEQIFMVEVKWNCYVAKHKIKLYPWKYVSQSKFTRKKNCLLRIESEQSWTLTAALQLMWQSEEPQRGRGSQYRWWKRTGESACGTLCCSKS